MRSVRVRARAGTGLLLDFWERYDAERVWSQGFAIVGSKLLSAPASLCYLCGSAGRDELVYCCSCCEPFHPFCVADSSPLPLRPAPAPASAADDEPGACGHWPTDDQRRRVASVESTAVARRVPSVTNAAASRSWYCRNCLTCRVCLSGSLAEKISCSSCSSAYHVTCLAPTHPSLSEKMNKASSWLCLDCIPAQVS